MRRHRITKEMRAKKGMTGRTVVMSIAMGCMVYFGSIALSYVIQDRLFGTQRDVETGDKIVIAITACGLTVIAAILIWELCSMFYALIRGMYIGINDDYAIDFELVHYRLSHFYEEQDYYERRRTTRLYLTMNSDELVVLLKEQWTSVWFEGRAILPIKLAVPGRGFSRLYVCRSMLKRIAKETRQLRQSTFVELAFELRDNDYIGRTSYERDRILMSMWDVTELRTMYQGQPDIRFSDGSAKYLITWEQLERYEHTLTEAYQILDPQPITVHDNTM